MITAEEARNITKAAQEAKRKIAEDFIITEINGALDKVIKEAAEKGTNKARFQCTSEDLDANGVDSHYLAEELQKYFDALGFEYEISPDYKLNGTYSPNAISFWVVW